MFDWEIPVEWNIEDASVTGSGRPRVVDFQAHNLHLVGYSEPVAATLSLEAARAASAHAARPARLDSVPHQLLPAQLGFLHERARARCAARGTLPGRGEKLPRARLPHLRRARHPGTHARGGAVLHARCHPSLANDNTSGMAVATALAEWIAREPRRFTYRFVFAPGTIGSLTWLRRNEAAWRAFATGWCSGCWATAAQLLTSAAAENCEIDAIGAHLDRGCGHGHPLCPYGYDERQLCSPGFDLPVGRLTRSVNGGYPEYHTSADNMALITPNRSGRALWRARMSLT